MVNFPKTLREMVGPYQMLALPFNQTNVADAAGDAELWEATSVLAPPMPFGGFVAAISVRHNADLTGGVVTWNPTVDTVAKTALGVVTEDTIQQAHARCKPGLIPFAAGANLGVSYTKTGTVAPTTTDVVGLLWVVLNHGDA